MGDVFDRIVSRASTAPDRSPAAGLTTRRRPVFGVPAQSEGGSEPGASGSMHAAFREVPVEHAAGEEGHALLPGGTDGAKTRRDTGGSVRRPVSLATRSEPEVGGRAREDPPGADRRGLGHEASSTYEPEHRPPAFRPSHRQSAADGPRPTRPDVTGPAPEPAPGGPPPDDVAAHAGVADGVEASDDPTPGVRPARVDLRPPPPSPGPRIPTTPARTVPAEELLREHLAPALVDRGAVNAQDVSHLTAVGIDPIQIPGGGDLHVHLGQVVVQRAIASDPEPPRPANRDAGRRARVDHADYLDRQRRRW